MATIYLICEGHRGGLDQKVLNNIIAQNLQKDKDVVIKAAGGGTQLGTVAKYIEEDSWDRRADGTLGRTAVAYFIEDRDHRSLDEVKDIWGKPGGRRFMWRRHEIENYLLDPRVVAGAFESLKKAAPVWPDTLPQTPEQVDAVLQQLARPMIEDHVGRLTYEQLLRQKRTTVDTGIKRPQSLQPPSGARYPGRQEWLDYLGAECSRVKQDCTTFAGTPEFDMPAVTALYDQLLSEVY